MPFSHNLATDRGHHPIRALEAVGVEPSVVRRITSLWTVKNRRWPLVTQMTHEDKTPVALEKEPFKLTQNVDPSCHNLP
jgi:hypothetical protein